MDRSPPACCYFVFWYENNHFCSTSILYYTWMTGTLWQPRLLENVLIDWLTIQWAMTAVGAGRSLPTIYLYTFRGAATPLLQYGGHVDPMTSSDVISTCIFCIYDVHLLQFTGLKMTHLCSRFVFLDDVSSQDSWSDLSWRNSFMILLLFSLSLLAG